MPQKINFFKKGALSFLTFGLLFFAISVLANDKSASINAYQATPPFDVIGIIAPKTLIYVNDDQSGVPESFRKVKTLNQKNQIVEVLVKTSDLPQQSENRKVEHPLSLGAGLSGYSSSEKSQIQISGELRYLWNWRNEAMVGLELSFGSDSAVGMRIGERHYIPLGSRFSPYLHFGLRSFDVTSPTNMAFDPGFGIQFTHPQGAFVELGANYLWASPFEKGRENIWIFGGSSGLRF